MIWPLYLKCRCNRQQHMQKPEYADLALLFKFAVLYLCYCIYSVFHNSEGNFHIVSVVMFHVSCVMFAGLVRWRLWYG